MSGARVLIAGGGMVGLAFAIALAERGGEVLNIELIEARPLPTGDPDPLDSRASALNLHSRALLDSYGVWDSLAPDAAPIRDIHISNQHRFGSTLLHAADVGDEALGYVAENHRIGRALLARAQALGVVLRENASITGLSTMASAPGLQMADGQQESAELVILADGGHSSLRSALGIGVESLVTGQVAVVANVAFAGEQQGIAFERFTGSGPLALLPLTSAGSGSRFNVVWSMAEPDAETLAGMAEADFLAALQAAFGWRLGRVEKVGQRTVWPLSRLRAREQSRPGYLVAGNAAHALHPVAGQGFNLSLRDAEAFALAVRRGLADGLSPGETSVLRDYEESVTADQALTMGATDRLATLFNRRGPLLDVPRDMALACLDLSDTLRREVATLGTGQRGSGGRV